MSGFLTSDSSFAAGPVELPKIKNKYWVLATLQLHFREPFNLDEKNKTKKKKKNSNLHTLQTIIIRNMESSMAS